LGRQTSYYLSNKCYSGTTLIRVLKKDEFKNGFPCDHHGFFMLNFTLMFPQTPYSLLPYVVVLSLSPLYSPTFQLQGPHYLTTTRPQSIKNLVSGTINLLLNYMACFS